MKKLSSWPALIALLVTFGLFTIVGAGCRSQPQDSAEAELPGAPANNSVDGPADGSVDDSAGDSVDGSADDSTDGSTDDSAGEPAPEPSASEPGTTVAEPSRITADQLVEVFEDSNVFLLDVREPAEIEELGTVEGYTNIPIDQLEARLDELPRDRPILTA